ncbi:hypothetical protein CLU79DRAFT_811145 [Phycomyces nitens]|nr:hypothetical protein CLU79DRAFT_811145 [Phycomyces nitens]
MNPTDSKPESKRRPMSRPIPRVLNQTNDQSLKRQFELTQLSKRFQGSFSSTDTRNGSQIRLVIPPSDPDFPFDLDALEVLLMVPTTYPVCKPSLTITNHDIPKGFSRNLESGYDAFVRNCTSFHLTLVQQMDWLDRNMQDILQKPPAPTIRFVSVPNPSQELRPVVNSHNSTQQSKKALNPNAAIFVSALYTPEQKGEAAKRRHYEMRQLQTRFGTFYSLIKANGHETVCLIQLDWSDLDPSVQEQIGNNLTVKYSIPLMYPLEPCSISIQEPPLEEFRNTAISNAFSIRVKDSGASLFQNLNWLNRNISSLYREATPPVSPPQPNPETIPETPQQSKQSKQSKPAIATREIIYNETKDNRVIVVKDPLLLIPPNVEPKEEEALESDQPVRLQDIVSSPRRGTEIRLENVCLKNVALARCVSVSMVLKCARCKGSVVMDNIQPEETNTKHESWKTCPTCTLMVGVKFLADWIHPNASTLGILQLVQLSPISLVSFSLAATCAQCLIEPSSSVQFNSPRVLNQQCSSCFTKMSLGYEDHRYFRIGTDDGQFEADEAQVMKLKQKTPPNTKVPGQPLPDKGRCSHYRKSKRWFRFPCCQKLYPCNTCHDLDQDHPYTYAQRHVCGMCSREQAILPQCAGCNHAFEPEKHKGAFWEGGQGMRDKAKMSRKDTRKHKGIEKLQSRKQDRVG